MAFELKASMTMTQSFTLTLEQLVKLDGLKEKLGISKSEAVRQGIDLLFAQEFPEWKRPGEDVLGEGGSVRAALAKAMGVEGLPQEFLEDTED